VGYLVVLEKAEKNWAAYSPDVTGCVATGRSPEETLKRYEKALRIHFEGLREDGLPLPVPVARAVTVEI
jgi:predicted RNase H-like HicB family nuclease